ncbi:hypothetical protein DE146DRAFT_637150 [Phaeosphaeria sp. MPI-PUGE-AT-0046c]|nr:hypothetical protein DE146DRAFT_637150 [Phaeosphaeria sp. MPI-PUGE-AT-0046c]
MTKEESARKVLVRKHQPSCWSVWFGKNKTPEEEKDRSDDYEKASMQAHQGSRGGRVPQDESHRGSGDATPNGRESPTIRPNLAGADEGFPQGNDSAPAEYDYRHSVTLPSPPSYMNFPIPQSPQSMQPYGSGGPPLPMTSLRGTYWYGISSVLVPRTSDMRRRERYVERQTSKKRRKGSKGGGRGCFGCGSYSCSGVDYGEDYEEC